MKRILLMLVTLAIAFVMYGQTTNTLPLPAGGTVIGGHLHAGASNEVWTDASSLYFNYRGNATATYFWNKNGTTGSSVLSILSTGNVGIGTTNPTALLDVAGVVRTNRMFVNDFYNGAQIRLNSSGSYFGKIGNPSAQVWSLGWGSSGTDINPVLTWGASGNVGIGTTSPAEALHVNGSVRGNQAGALRISTGNGYLDLGPQNSSWAHIYTDRPAVIFNTPVYSVVGKFSSYSTSGLTLQTNGTDRLIINSESFNFTNGTNKRIYVNDNSIRLNTSTDICWNYGATYNFSIIHYNNMHSYITYGENLFFRLSTDINSSPLILQGDGNIAIGFGTSYTAGARYTQGYKLAVNGSILCEGVKVIADVPNSDYVFNNDYKLMNLPMLEKFVMENKHLPDVPSAEEFKKNGYKIGEMDNLLLKKVEELTLYVIEINKKLVIFEKENELLKQKQTK